VFFERLWIEQLTIDITL